MTCECGHDVALHELTTKSPRKRRGCVVHDPKACECKQYEESDVDNLAWKKASASAGAGACVEVAHLDNGGVAVRDSKDPDGPTLTFTRHEWDAFVAGARDGEFDL